MANFKPQALDRVLIDGEVNFVPAQSTIEDVVPSNVTAVQVVDAAGNPQLMTRDQFKQPVPAAFTTQQTAVARG